MDNSGFFNNWTKQETLKLIEEYKKYAILYKVEHPDHLKCNKKREAIMAIVEALKCLKPNVSENLVKAKLKTLRHQMASEKKKINCAKKNGTGTSALCKPSLWCYEELSFLLDSSNEQTSTTNLNISQIFNDRQLEEHRRREQNFVKPKKVKQETGMDEFQKTINKSMEIIEKMSANKVTSKEEAFCIYLSAELTALKLEESFDEFKMSAMILLQNVKTKEKQILSDNNSVWRDSSSALLPSPFSFKCRASSASCSAYSGSADRLRRRSCPSDSESILDGTMRSSSNDFDACDEFLSNDVKCEVDVDCHDDDF